MKTVANLVLLVIAMVWVTPGHAADCKVDKPAADLTLEELDTLYECVRPDLIKGYQKKKKEKALAYTDWKAASTTPQAPGTHSGQYLMTYVNPVGFDQYIQYNTDSTEMPNGTIIAKEAFTITKKGKIKKGPLLFMERVGLEAAPKTGGWKYSGLKPNGKKLKVKAAGFCHACHQAWPHQNFMGYPVEAVRVKG